MKRYLAFICIFFGALALMGMGGTPQGSIPEPDENLTATLTDRSGVQTEISKFSMDGNVYFEGSLGQGKVTIFFRNMKSLEVGSIQGDEVKVLLHMKSGEDLSVLARKRATFYGDTAYGTFRIRALDVRKIDFR